MTMIELSKLAAVPFSRGWFAVSGLALLMGAVALSCGSDDSGAANNPGPSPCEGPYADQCGQACSVDDNCPDGLYCSVGTCTADCIIGESACPSGQVCTSRGRCVTGGDGGVLDGSLSDGGDSTTSDVCADITVTIEQVVPTVMLLIDQSGSMTESFGGTNRWNAVRDTLMDGSTGIVHQLESDVRFGLSLYTSHGGGASCPELTQVPVALDNYDAIQAVYGQASAEQDTPTGDAVEVVATQMVPLTEPGPKIIVLATDGEPDTCADPNSQTGQPEVIAAVEEAYSNGIETYVISVGDGVSQSHLQDVANAGVGNAVGGGTNAPYYQALDPQALVDAFDTIINGARSCVYALNGEVQPGMESLGRVELDGSVLGYGSADGWQLNSPSEIELLGDACDAIKEGEHELVVTFPCDAVVVGPTK